MNTTSDTISAWFGRLCSSIKSIAKLLVLSKRPTVTNVAHGSGDIIILGNGPSLNDTISQYPHILSAVPTMAVNFAANADVFTTLKPRFYLLADPYFFSGKDDPNLTKLMARFADAVDWDMTLFVPATFRRAAIAINNPRITLEYYNAIGVEGFQWLENLAFSSGRGMPRPRNVLIPSIMVATLLGYRNIYLVGADHSWLRTLSVNDQNEVISVQPHFYEEEQDEKERVKREYTKYPLHHIIYSFYVAFKSYFTIERYATSRGINIYNATPDSFIDAFPRKALDDLAK